MDPRIKQAVEIIESEFDQPLSVKILSARLHLSPSRLEHLIKKETGRNFKTLLEGRRMRHAEILLPDPTIRIKDVTTAVGYPDVSNFNHYFRKSHGQSPSQFRASRTAGVTLLKG
jgi:YesN/AraC family two-component response regulator